MHRLNEMTLKPGLGAFHAIWPGCGPSSRGLHGLDWIEQCFLRPRQHSIGYMGDSFYRSKDPANSIKVLKEQIVHRQIKHTISRHEHKTQQVP